MRYVSTRGGAKTYSFEEAIIAGWADNGGMILPQSFPRFTADALKAMRSMSYMELCFAVLRPLIDAKELSSPDLEHVLRTALGVFDDPRVVPTVPLGDDTGLFVCELWHGPTLAFKDLGLQVLGALLDHFLAKRKERLMVLVGTSGDTGSAAIEAVRGKSTMDIVVLFPQGRISHVQEMQMTTVAQDEANVEAWAVEGTSDDLDKPIAALFRDGNFKQRHRLGSLNSVNVARVLMQAVHYFYAYFRTVDEAQTETLQFVVPTGAGGHITGGIIAQKMGLPVALCAATNENDIVHRLFAKGDLSLASEVVQTNSPSMDIQVPYNIERIFFLLYDDTNLVAQIMSDFDASGRSELPKTLVDDLHARLGLTSDAITSATVLKTIRTEWEKHAYLLDPHTAVAVAAARRLQHTSKSVCMACAHPAKFVDTIAEALQVEPDMAEAFVTSSTPDHRHVSRVIQLRSKKTTCRILRKVEDWEAALRKHIEGVSKQHGS